MDIQVTSFILGMCAMLVTAVVVGSVFAVVKVVKVSEKVKTNGYWAMDEFEKLRKDLDDREASLARQIDDTNKSVDSRCDKLYEKIMRTRSPKNEVFQMADESGFKETLLKVLNKEEEGNGLKDRILQLINKTT